MDPWSVAVLAPNLRYRFCQASFGVKLRMQGNSVSGTKATLIAKAKNLTQSPALTQEYDTGLDTWSTPAATGPAARDGHMAVWDDASGASERTHSTTVVAAVSVLVLALSSETVQFERGFELGFG